jgi:hypothetical protein
MGRVSSGELTRAELPSKTSIFLILMRFLPFTLFLAFGLFQAALAQTINPTTTVTPPAGTPSSPHFVIDQDSGVAPETRNKIPVTVRISFPLTSTGTSLKCRVSAQLLSTDGKNTGQKLENGSELSSVVVVNTKGSGTGSAEFLLNLDPASNLGAGIAYKVRAQLQNSSTLANIGSPVDSANFTVVHFAKEAAAHLNVKVHASAAPTLTRGFALSTNTLQNHFIVSVPLLFSRYAPGDEARNISFRLIPTLIDDQGTVIPLASTTIFGPITAKELLAFNSGTPNRPATATRTLNLSLRPQNQIDSVNRTYRVRVVVEVNQSTSFTATFENEGNVADMSGLRLMHFNGRLNFGTATNRITATTFTSISNTPVAGAFNPNPPSSTSPQTNGINTTLNFSSGVIVGQPDLQFSPASALPIILKATGEAVFNGATELLVTQSLQSAPGSQAGSIKLSYQNLRLRSSGLLADVRVHLPQGLSFTAARATSRGKFQAFVLAPNVAIDSSFGIGSGLVFTAPGADAWVFDESRPLLYRVNGLALNSSGVLDFLAAEAQWAQKPAFDQLETLKKTSPTQPGFHADVSMNTRLTNEGYLKFARLPAPNQPVKFVADTVDGTARTQAAALKINPGSFQPHLPSGSVVEWAGTGDFQISSGKVNFETSVLPTVPTTRDYRLSYDTGCRRNEDCNAAFPLRTLALLPAGAAFKFTPDGGLHAVVSLTGGPHDLAWDARAPVSNPAVFSHKVLGFTSGRLFFPGHQLYASDFEFPDPSVAAAPSLAGFQIDATETPGSARMIYPVQDDYRLGVGSYAGVNFTPGAGNGQIQEVRIGDMTSPDTVNLTDERNVSHSKYYARRGGVSGRTVAAKDSVLDALSIYGYPFSFTKHQLAFLSNGSEFVREPSRIEGAVVVKDFGTNDPAFTQPFVGLNILCQGALGDAAPGLSDPPEKPLKYWQGSFRPLGLQFVPTAPTVPPDDDCEAGPRQLSLMVQTQVANLVLPSSDTQVPLPIVGTLLFKPDGNLGTLADKEASGVDSRLGLPATVHVKGPGEELYRITPVSRLYFNNPAQPNAPNIGFAGFAGLCQVPFFQDMQVHVVTSATAASTAFSLFMTGGWTEGGQTYFTHENFDLVHRGLPPANLVSSFDAYRNPTPAPDGTLDQRFLARAKQSVFGILPLDYPLRWQPLSRDFIGVPQDPTDLLVLKLEHQLRYLSADNAELTFGAEFEDLKRLNLANIGTEALERVHRQAHGTVNGLADKLVGGVNKIDDLVSDNIDKMIDKVTGEIIPEIIPDDANELPGIAGDLYRALKASYEDQVLGSVSVKDTNRWLQSLENESEAAVGQAENAIHERLSDILKTLDNAAGFNRQIGDALDAAIASLDIVSGRFRVDSSEVPENQVYQVLADGTVQLVNPAVDLLMRDGLIRETLVGGETQRQIVKLMVSELIGMVLGDPEVRAMSEEAIRRILERLDDELNALLVEADPTLDRIQQISEDLKKVLIILRDEMDRSRGMINDLRDAVAEMDGLIYQVSQEVLNATARRIRQAAEQIQGAPLRVDDRVRDLFVEFAAEELGQFMKEQLRDRLMESGLIQNLQHILRQHIAELRMAVHGAIDQVYAEVNKIVREVVNKVLGDLEKQINGVIGPMADTVGAGSIDGYAHIEGDTLRRLRLDADVALRVPDPLQLRAYFEMMCYDSDTDHSLGSACPPAPGQRTVEVRIGALDIPLEWKPAAQPSPATVAEADAADDEDDDEEDEEGLRADLGVWFSFDGGGVPNGLGGYFTQTAGKFDFDSVVVSDLTADVGIGSQQAYLGARARVKVSEYEGFGGVFFGRTCSLDPLRRVDPDVADILGQPPFTGAYVYGEVWVPISEVAFGVPATCMFRVSAGVGAGVFYFAEGPVYGGRLKLGVTGEALCAVTIAGDIDLLGAMTPEGMKFRGIGTISGAAGECPLCLSFSDSLTLTYEGGVWDAKF